MNTRKKYSRKKSDLPCITEFYNPETLDYVFYSAEKKRYL